MAVDLETPRAFDTLANDAALPIEFAPFNPYLFSWWNDVQIQMLFKSNLEKKKSTSKLLLNPVLKPWAVAFLQFDEIDHTEPATCTL